jgi:hypothetical protein
MKKNIVAILVLYSLSFAAPIQKQENPDFKTMEQIVRVATQSLSGKGFRVVFASEDDRESLHLRHWIYERVNAGFNKFLIVFVSGCFP